MAESSVSPDKLFTDRRKPHAIEPGIHALVIGTSHYPRASPLHPPLFRSSFKDVEGAATGAAQFAEFVATGIPDGFCDPTGLPVRSVRLLLSHVDSEDEYLSQLSGPWRGASRENVRKAITDWFIDCNTHSNNVAVMYVAGHGIVTTRGEPVTAFLSGVNQELDQFEQAINMISIRQAMIYCQAQTNIYVTDCCSVPSDKFEGFGGIGLNVPIKAEGKRRFDLLIAGAREGTSGFAISAREGTLLSYALMRSLKTAGEIVRDRFTIRRGRLEEELPKEIRTHPKSPRQGGQEPRVYGEDRPTGIHLPTPPPTFLITFRNTNTEVHLDVSFKMQLNTNLATAYKVSLNGAVSSVEVPAGIYLVDLPSNIFFQEVDAKSGVPISGFSRELVVDRKKHFQISSPSKVGS